MSTVDLMLLGVLLQEPMNAYEMKKAMEYRNIQDWVRVSSPSIYKNLVKLHKSGYIDGRTIREGEMPEKTIYSINDRGREYFVQLMRRYSVEPGKVYVDFCAFISNLHNLDPETGLEMIEDLQETLATKRDDVDGQLESKDGVSFYATEVIGLYSQMYNLFYDWLVGFKERYIENSKAG